MKSPLSSFELRRWLKSVSVEPSYFLYVVVSTIVEFTNTNLYLQKACRTNATSEPDLDTPCDDNVTGITFVAALNAYVLSVKMFVVLIFIIIYSSWSDRAGRQRKRFIMLPMVGLLLESGFGALYAYLWRVGALYAALTSAVLQMAFGNFPTLQIFSCMYLADVVEVDSRTMRLGVLTALKVFGLLMSKSVAGFVLHAFGFFKSYMVCVGLASLTIVSAYYCVVDISVPVEKKVSPCSIFNVCRLVESFKIVLGNRSGKQKVTVLLLFFMFSFLMFVHEGQNTVLYLYLRFRFDWNEQLYSLFLFYGSVGTIVGTLFSSVILSKILKIHDGIIGIIAGIWDATVAISYIFADENWHLFLVSGMDIFFGVSITVCVSLVTKFYKSSEMGHLFALKQMFCLIIPFCHPVYSIIFQQTLHTMPYAFFFISFALYIVAVILFCVIYSLTKK